MAFCTNCSYSVASTTSFCGHCGHDLRGASAASQTFCIYCGQAAQDTASFCYHCGHDLRGVSLATKPPAASPAESSPPVRPQTGDGGVQPVMDAPHSPQMSEPLPLPSMQSAGSSRALAPGELIDSRPGTPAAAGSSPQSNLLLFSALFAIAGLILILVVAPEQKRWQTFVGYVVTEYYWIVIVVGAVCLLLAGISLMAAIVSSDQ